MKIVDNSQLAQDGMVYKRSPRIIQVYNKTGVATIGDRILLAIKGQKQKAIVVGCKNYIRYMCFHHHFISWLTGITIRRTLDL
jgi:hypothetical protein